MAEELWQEDVAGLRALYESREASPVEVLHAYTARIADVDPTIGAFVELTLASAEASARAAADDLAKGVWHGPLHGIPIGIKELFDVAHTTTKYGSLAFNDHVPGQDAHVVERLRAAGAIVVGLTRSHEFGWGITSQNAALGSTKNPWNLDRVPGGSSGGAAAAVATGMLPIALGSDTGASVRLPASYCGVMGLKPTYGRISLRGAVAVAPSLDHPGVLARTTRDLALGLEVMAGYDPADPSTHLASAWVDDGRRGDTQGVRLGTAPCLHTMPLDPTHEKAFWQAVDVVGAAMGSPREVSIDSPEAIRPAWATIQRAEAYYTHRHVLGTFPSLSHLYGDDVRARFEEASHVDVAQYIEAREEGKRVGRRFEIAFESVDALLTPVTAGPPATRARPDTVDHRGEEVAFRDLVLEYTVPQNLTGLPSCAVPIGIDGTGVPIGIQVTAAANREDVALGVAERIRRLIPFDAWPPAAR